MHLPSLTVTTEEKKLVLGQISDAQKPSLFMLQNVLFGSEENHCDRLFIMSQLWAMWTTAALSSDLVLVLVLVWSWSGVGRIIITKAVLCQMDALVVLNVAGWIRSTDRDKWETLWNQTNRMCDCNYTRLLQLMMKMIPVYRFSQVKGTKWTIKCLLIV